MRMDKTIIFFALGTSDLRGDRIDLPEFKMFQLE